MSTLSPKLVRQLFLLTVVVSLFILIFKELTPYLSGLLGAITLFVLLRKFMVKLTRRGWKEHWAAAVLMFLSFIIILVPVSLIVLMLTSKISKAVNNSEKVVSAVKNQIAVWEEDLGINLSASIDTQSVTDFISKEMQALAGGTFNALIAISIMYFILYFMLVNQKKLLKRLFEYIPLGTDNINVIGIESAAMVRSNALGIPMVALAQGIVALIGYFIFGVPDPMFWFVITAIGSMIPFIGTMLGIVPVTILLYAGGESTAALGIAIYGLVVVGSTDNILRLFILDRLASVHPLVTLFGVIVGVPLFGFIGLIFGPLLISLFLLVAKIYKNEFGKKPEDLPINSEL